MNWTMNLPVRVEFGAGALNNLGKHLGGARRVFLVTGRHAMRAAGVTDKILRLVAEAGGQAQVFDEIPADPNYEVIESAAEQARRFGAEVVIGCGGGSAMDSAKAVAVAATHPGPIMDYMMGGSRQITASALPVIAVSATSGTGSHVGRVAVLDSVNSRLVLLAADGSFLVNVPRLVSCYYELKPDASDPTQRVAFGTSGHRGSAFKAGFNYGETSEDFVVSYEVRPAKLKPAMAMALCTAPQKTSGSCSARPGAVE